MPFDTSDLPDAAFLSSKGYLPDRTEGSGTAVRFVFEKLSREQAVALLASRERELCIAYHRGLRACRRLIDRAQSNGGRRT